MKLTNNMRATLKLAKRGPLRRIHNPNHPGPPAWPANHATLAALVRHHLLERQQIKNKRGYNVNLWTITPAGRQALEPAERFREARPLYLARGSVRFRKQPNGRWAVITDSRSDVNEDDYTSDPRQSIDRDRAPTARTQTAVPVLVDRDDLDAFTRRARRREEARKRSNGDRLDTKTSRERLEQLQRVAREHHVNISDECRLIRHMIDSGRENDALRRITKIETNLQQRAA